MSKSDPQVFVFMKEGGKDSSWHQIGKTELINNNLNPDFSEQIVLNYLFEKEQHLQFQVYDIDRKTKEKDFIGQMETSIAKIMSQKNLTFIGDLGLQGSQAAKRGKIIIRADVINRNNDDIKMRVRATLEPKSTLGCCKGINNPYYVISRARPEDPS
jgi:Ca2+-dependent lipid-binding protein